MYKDGSGREQESDFVHRQHIAAARAWTRPRALNGCIPNKHGKDEIGVLLLTSSIILCNRHGFSCFPSVWRAGGH